MNLGTDAISSLFWIFFFIKSVIKKKEGIERKYTHWDQKNVFVVSNQIYLYRVSTVHVTVACLCYLILTKICELYLC